MTWKIDLHDENFNEMEPISVTADTKTQAYLEALLQLGPDFYPATGKCGIIGITVIDIM